MQPMWGLFFEMLAEETRHTLAEVREGHHKEAERELEVTLRFLQLARTMCAVPFRPYAREAREEALEWNRWYAWRTAPEWLREQWRLRRAEGVVPWVDPITWEPWEGLPR